MIKEVTAWCPRDCKSAGTAYAGSNPKPATEALHRELVRGFSHLSFPAGRSGRCMSTRLEGVPGLPSQVALAQRGDLVEEHIAGDLRSVQHVADRQRLHGQHQEPR